MRAVSRTASASSARDGPGIGVVAQPVGERRHGGAGLRRIGTTAGGHTLGSQSVLSTATIRRTRWPERYCCVIAAGLGTLIYLQFRGDLTDKDKLTLLSSRAGLVVDPGSKVTFNGVEIGRVSQIGMVDVDGTPKAKLTLDVDPAILRFIPTNVVAEIRATTVFGNKYISFSSPDEPGTTTDFER